MDSADSIPKEVWETLDRAASTPLLLWLVLGAAVVLATTFLVCNVAGYPEDELETG